MPSQEPFKKCVPFACALHILDLILVAIVVYFAAAYMPDKDCFAERYKSNLVMTVFVVSRIEFKFYRFNIYF